MRGGRTKVSQYVNVNPRYKLQQTFNGGVESYVSVAGVFYKVHTFSSTGTLAFSSQATTGLDTEYLVIAGGGGGGSFNGGGGAGGYRNSVVGETTGGGGSAESKLSLVAEHTPLLLVLVEQVQGQAQTLLEHLVIIRFLGLSLQLVAVVEVSNQQTV
jgi:hypothetical protein